jgi:hypothetical protein
MTSGESSAHLATVATTGSSLHPIRSRLPAPLGAKVLLASPASSGLNPAPTWSPAFAWPELIRTRSLVRVQVSPSGTLDVVGGFVMYG